MSSPMVVKVRIHVPTIDFLAWQILKIIESQFIFLKGFFFS
jgi:hypothetical protein